MHAKVITPEIDTNQFIINTNLNDKTVIINYFVKRYDEDFDEHFIDAELGYTYVKVSFHPSREEYIFSRKGDSIVIRYGKSDDIVHVTGYTGAVVFNATISTVVVYDYGVTFDIIGYE